MMRGLKDESEIRNLIATYGPHVDHGDSEAVAAIWVPDGVYDVDGGAGGYRGREEIAAMVRSKPHQDLIDGGCAHVLGPLHVAVSGDEATAIGYSLLVAAQGEQHTILRMSANTWYLVRTDEGWRVTRRVNRRLSGSASAHAVLVEALGP